MLLYANRASSTRESMFSLRNIRRRETRGWTLIGLPPAPAFNARTALLERAGSSVWMPDVTPALRDQLRIARCTPVSRTANELTCVYSGLPI
jgi:hypothetical protein